MPLLLPNASTHPTTIDDRVQRSDHRSEEVPRHLSEQHDQESQQPHPPLHKVDLNQVRANHEQEHQDNSHNQQELPPHPELQLRRESQTQLSDLAQSALFNSMSIHHAKPNNTMPAIVAPALHPVANLDGTMTDQLKVVAKAPATLAAPERPSSLRHRHTDERVGFAQDVKDEAKPRPMASGDTNGHVVGSPTAKNDTPATTAPSSPSM